LEYIYKSPLGDMLITYDDNHILGTYFDRAPSQEYIHNNVIESCINQLDKYFTGELRHFDLPLNPAGTAFQKLVWDALQKIPYGQTATYGQIAAKIGKPKAARAVGGANNKNPLLVIVPCHRVIGANGGLVGFACGMERKTALLKLEGFIS